ncbi:class I SAM-dependent methyltransferase [Rufibacter roseolus]|uniref:class I SAM-dependent methyltransferase n=1 Tax=Rufibacter roseolus TaxID=2817375 RepID=UPI001B3019CE|nr:class I SAM-dependent methyltransferase [Rufibacter roseolus]
MQFVDQNSLIKPEYVPESAWHKHSPFVFWLLARLKPKCIVELGVHNGFSFFVFCQYALDRLRAGKCMCYAIDHWQGDEHAGIYDTDIFQKFIQHQGQYLEVSKVIKSTFREGLSYFEDESIDLLHIDGRHYYDDVKEDFNDWKRKLKKDAIVLFHDTQVFDSGFGVHQFWAEVHKEFSLVFEFLHGHGLGVLCFGDGQSLPITLRKFFALSGRQKDSVSAVYHRLGNEVHFEYLLKAYGVQFDSS